MEGTHLHQHGANLSGQAPIVEKIIEKPLFVKHREGAEVRTMTS